jgi:hypothetical protein
LPTIFPPEPGFAQHRVGGLPLPVHGGPFVTGLDQHRPDFLEDASLAPPLEPAVDRAIVAEVLGEMVPLTSGSEAEDDPVDRRAPIDPGSAAMVFGLGRAILPEDRFDPLPEVVVDFPDRLEWFGRNLSLSQGCVS